MSEVGAGQVACLVHLLQPGPGAPGSAGYETEWRVCSPPLSPTPLLTGMCHIAADL